MMARPTKWARFIEKEHAFWVRRGLPIHWAGAIREYERGWVAKALVAFTVIFAVVLIVAAILLPHHG